MAKINWLTRLKFDPLSQLISSENNAIRYFTRRDLLDENVGSLTNLWELPEARKIIAKQQLDGSWKYPGGYGHIRSEENYNQIETYRNLAILVEKYALSKKHGAIRKAAEYLFSFQTKEGDFRGIYGNQYTPNYSAGIAELLIKVGYENDRRIEKLFRWLISIRQNDGGWAIPLRTRKAVYSKAMSKPLIELDRSRPFSHLVTGVVLRAYAAHPKYCKSKETKLAGMLLASRFFKNDVYPDRKTANFWLRFSYPFWFTDLLSSLDSLSLIGFSSSDPEIKKALDWFINHQQETGVWKLKLVRGSDRSLPLWLSLAICRVFKRLCDS